LSYGNHTVLVRDANGCTAQASAEIREAEDFLVSLGPDVEIKRGDTITLYPLTSPANHTLQGFEWANASGLVCPTCLNTPVVPEFTTSYTMTVWDMNGCEATASVTVHVIPDWYMANIFAVNADNPDNSWLTIYDNGDIENIELLQLFDRWGELVFENQNFKPNDPSKGWNGHFKGKIANPGVYCVYGKIRYFDGTIDMISQDVTLWVGKK
jgi:hypothetical protein